jgi:hypothetical protein
MLRDVDGDTRGARIRAVLLVVATATAVVGAVAAVGWLTREPQVAPVRVATSPPPSSSPTPRPNSGQADGRVAVTLPAKVWSGMDGGVDNAVDLAAVDGNERVVSVGSAIREAGWRQVPWVDGEWPPLEQRITITLTRAQWAFIRELSVKDLPIYEDLGDEESAALCRAALAVLDAAGL